MSKARFYEDIKIAKEQKMFHLTNKGATTAEKKKKKKRKALASRMSGHEVSAANRRSYQLQVVVPAPPVKYVFYEPINPFLFVLQTQLHR